MLLNNSHTLRKSFQSLKQKSIKQKLFNTLFIVLTIFTLQILQQQPQDNFLQR